MLRLALRAVVGDSFLPDDDYTTQVRKTTSSPTPSHLLVM